MNKETLNNLVNLARQQTVFYKHLYQHVPEDISDLTELPVATHEKIMAIAHDAERVSDIFSVQHAHGMYYQSSATTGKAKSTLFGRDDWCRTNALLAEKHTANKVICAGDIVCNISVAGSASFMAVHDIINISPSPCSEIPLGCDHDYQHIVNVCQQFNANVISGVNSTILGLACHLFKEHQTLPQIKRIWGGGELFYGAQQQLISRVFPDAVFIPFLYGTTEAGAIGYSRPGYAQNVFNTLDDSVIVENIDIKTGLKIVDCGVKGSAVITNRLRLSAPAIRLDTGDFMKWIDPEGTPERRFSIHGRRYPKQWTIREIHFTETDVIELLSAIEIELDIIKFQLRLSKDRISVIVSLLNQNSEPSTLKEKLDHIFIMTENPVARCLVRNNYTLNIVDIDYFTELSRRKSKFIIEE
ncbi:hypothetical protein AB9K40_28180 [Klebsiella pneumoniae]|uniref:hypothetical protein n=1 Tax=Klebsiella variicola TaxID=244366 RepID=UPI003529B369